MVKTWGSLVAGCLLMVLAAAGCDADGVPDISEVDEAKLVVALSEQQHCCSQSSLVWIGDARMRFTEEDRVGIAAAIPAPVRFYTDVSEAFGEAESLPDGEVSVKFSKPRKVKKDVVAIDQHFSSGPFNATWQTWLFQWNGETSVIVEPEQVDVTVTSSVS